MAESDNSSPLGRKIFFLHPSALVQNQIITELVQDEYEVYSVKSEVKLVRVLKKYPDSIVMACINEGMKESAWEAWLKGVMSENSLSNIDVGIIVSADDLNLRNKFAASMKLACGYTVLKTDLASVIKQLKGLLNNVNAKGRRKYIRVLIDKESNTTVNLPMNGTFIHGLIKDLSMVGFACTFADDPQIVKNSLFSDIQIRLQTALLKAEGIVFGSRMDGDEKTYVLLFTKRTSPDVQAKIRKFIQNLLQSRMDLELK